MLYRVHHNHQIKPFRTMRLSDLIQAEDVAKNIADQLGLRQIKWALPGRSFQVINLEHPAERDYDEKQRRIARHLSLLLPQEGSDVVLVSDTPKSHYPSLDFSSKLDCWWRIQHHFSFGVPCTCCEFGAVPAYNQKGLEMLLNGNEEGLALLPGRFEALQFTCEECEEIERVFMKMPPTGEDQNPGWKTAMNELLPVEAVRIREHNPFWFVDE